jgi:hypothetical protein
MTDMPRVGEFWYLVPGGDCAEVIEVNTEKKTVRFLYLLHKNIRVIYPFEEIGDYWVQK